MRLLLYLFFAVLSVPLIEVIALTLIWSGSLAHPWYFFFVGCIVAYAIAGAVLFVVQAYSKSGGWDFTEGNLLKHARQGSIAKSSEARLFDGLTLVFVGLLSTVIILEGMALWVLRSFFTG